MIILVVLCDTLVMVALDRAGKRIVRQARARHAILGQRPFYVAHTLWPADIVTASKGLDCAWSTLPILLGEHGSLRDEEEIRHFLHRYTTELLVTGTPHSTDLLRFRMQQLSIVAQEVMT